MSRNLWRNILCYTVACSLILLQGCGGRAANPVSTIKAGDESMSCNALLVEMSNVEKELLALIPESKKTGKNVALGTAGLFLIVPFFFMDSGSAEKVEMKALRDRYSNLERRYAAANCGTGGQTDSSTKSTSNNDISSRLTALKQLLDDGLIDEEQYEITKTKILNDL